MYSKKINQLATNLNPQITDLIPVGDAITGQLKTATYGGVSGITGDGVISGGIVTWTGTGLVFNISACTYILNGVRYSSPLTSKTLASADPTNPRIDVFAVNTSGQVEVIQGIPNANPVEPEGDTPTTLGLTNVTIAAGATTPSDVTRDLIYDENVESWTKIVQVGGGTTYNLADTAFAFKGTKSILATMGAGFIFFRFSKAVAMDISNYKSLSFAIRLNTAWISNTTLSVRFYNTSNNTSSNLFQINSTNNVGFNRNLAGEWQLITIPFNNTNLKFTNNAFTEIRISTSNAAATYRLDTIQLNGGINNPIGGGTTPSNSFGFVNGSTGTASATTATDTLNVVGTGLATTSATGKTLTIAVPNPVSGTLNYVSKFTGTGTTIGNSQIFDNGTSVGIGTTSPSSANLLQVEGIITSNTTKTYAGGTTLSNNVGSTQASVSYNFGGNATIPNSIVTSSILALSNFAFTGTGTVSQSQSASIRTLSNIFSQISFSGSVNGIISHVANTRISAPYSASSATLTITNYYGLILEDSTQFTPITATNRWGIYQEGASDDNYFGGKIAMGTTSPSASARLQIDSTSGGFLMPRMTASQRTAISTPAIGLLVYQTDSTEGFYQYASTGWSIVGGGGNNIYTANGTLTSDRSLTHGGFHLSFVGGTFTNRFTTTGRLLLGTTTEGTNILQINGDTGFNGVFYSTYGTNNSTINIIPSGRTPTTSSYAVAIGRIASFNNAAIEGCIGIGQVTVNSNSQSSIAMGWDTTIGGSYSIGIGRNATANGGNAVALGYLANSTGGIAIRGTSGSSGIAIGPGSNSATGTEPIAIGSSAIANGFGAIQIGRYGTSNGQNCIGIGTDTSITHSYSIGMGRFAKSNAANQFIIGGTTASESALVNDIYIGYGARSLNASTPQTNITIQPTIAFAGTNIAGGSFILAGGRATGSGAAGDVIIQTSTSLASGTTLQTLTERLRIKGTQGSVRFQPIATPTVAEAGDVYYDSTSNKLRCYNGTTWNDLF